MNQRFFKNKLAFYILSRYLTYFIQFVTSLLLANKLGPASYGIWGVIILIITYFGLFNFGLSNSINIILVQNKDDIQTQSKYITNDIFLIGLLSVIILCIAVAYVLSGGSWFSSYSIGYEFLLLCLVAILAHFNLNFLTIYRVYNDYNRIAFNQSIIPALMFISVFLFEGKSLLYSLISSYVIGNVLSIICYLHRKPFSFIYQFQKKESSEILKKGWWLFLYNLCFYMILVSTRTIISKHYSLDDFGFFTFSFTLGDSVQLLFQAVANVAFPKVLSKLQQKDGQIKSTINLLNNTYITIIYFSVLFVSLLFPLILIFFPKYSSCSSCMTLVAVTMAVYTRSFPYSTYLMSNNFEKKLFVVAIICLCTNVALAYVLVYAEFPYDYIIISTLISYYLFYVICNYLTNKTNKSEKLNSFDFGFFVPIVTAVIIAFIRIEVLYPIPLILFVFMNRKRFCEIRNITKKLINNYKIINL